MPSTKRQHIVLVNNTLCKTELADKRVGYLEISQQHHLAVDVIVGATTVHTIPRFSL